MIESGSNLAGIGASEFDMPLTTAFRIEVSSPAMRPLIAGYELFDSEPPEGQGYATWLLPGWAKIWINLGAGPITVDLRRRRYAPIGPAIVYGVTSCAMPMMTHGGLTLGIDVNPLAWARYVSQPADALRDRVTPMEQVFEPALVQDILAALGEGQRLQDVQPVLDAVFLRHLSPANPDEPLIARMFALFERGEVTNIAAAAETLDVSAGTLRRVCTRYCGFPPKVLLMRTRFLNAIVPQLLGEIEADTLPPGYFDAPHYLRDASRFLGMTPRRFLRLDTPYMRAVLRARRLVRATLAARQEARQERVAAADRSFAA